MAENTPRVIRGAIDEADSASPGSFGGYFDWARDLEPAAVCIWPYDQGGCGCARCQPWGARGFMRCVESVGTLAREKLPGAKIVLSTWYMDRKERDDVARQVRARPELADALLMEYFHEPFGPAPFADGATPACRDAFRELNRQYSVTDRTETVVRAPLAASESFDTRGSWNAKKESNHDKKRDARDSRQ